MNKSESLPMTHQMFPRKNSHSHNGSACILTLVSMGRSVRAEATSWPILFLNQFKVPAGFPTFPLHSIVILDFSWKGPAGASMVGRRGATGIRGRNPSVYKVSWESESRNFMTPWIWIIFYANREHSDVLCPIELVLQVVSPDTRTLLHHSYSHCAGSGSTPWICPLMIVLLSTGLS